MKFIRPIAGIFFYLTRGLAWFYWLTTLFLLSVLLLQLALPEASSLPIKIYETVNGTETISRFDLYLPFTQKPFILGRYSFWGVAEIVIGIGLYGLFFFLLSRIFDSFRQEKLFTAGAIKNLLSFSTASFILPLTFLLFLYIYPLYKVEGGEILVAVLHILLGVFALFQAAIFKEGYHLQQEQDLTI